MCMYVYVFVCDRRVQPNPDAMKWYRLAPPFPFPITWSTVLISYTQAAETRHSLRLQVASVCPSSANQLRLLKKVLG